MILNAFILIEIGLIGVGIAATRKNESVRLQDDRVDNDVILSEKSQPEDVAKQQQIDEDWMRRYEAMFLGEDGSQNVEQLKNSINDLYKTHATTSRTGAMKTLGQDMNDLVELTRSFAESCKTKNFAKFDILLKRYASGFNISILNYINHYRLKFWQMCKQKFMSAQRNEDKPFYHVYDYDNEVEAFSLVDHVSSSNPNASPWLKQDPDSVKKGLIGYIRDRLGRSSHKAKEFNSFFETKLIRLCSFVKERFPMSGEMAEIIRDREDLRKDLDAKSFKWLTAMKICQVIRENTKSIQEDLLQDFYRRHKELSLVDKIFGKNRV